MYTLKSVIPWPLGLEVGLVSPGLRVVTFKIDYDLLDRLDTYCRMKGLPRSEVIRRAIEHYLRKEWDEIMPRPKVVKLYS